ncbi:hypothetical protein B7760_02076 [Burkholderia glumae]|nr:hypothetical protein B7760_02076 [Burkholderia glumae]
MMNWLRLYKPLFTCPGEQNGAGRARERAPESGEMSGPQCRLGKG